MTKNFVQVTSEPIASLDHITSLVHDDSAGAISTFSGTTRNTFEVHLILSSLPQPIIQVISAFGWTPDRHLGFVLLKLCLQDRKAKSPMASVMLLTYYTALTSLCPHILTSEYTQPAIETLLDAQHIYPNSAIFLYLAGLTSRLARNLILSTQSFMYASEISKNEWAQVEISQACGLEMALNQMMQHRWQEALDLFRSLDKDHYRSRSLFRYLSAACLDRMGERTEAILTLAEVASLVDSSRAEDRYVLSKVKDLEKSGYQEMDMTLCALEYLYLVNAYEFMGIQPLEEHLDLVDEALEKVIEAEQMEYGIRASELMPETPPPRYEGKRGILLLLKVSILNAMGRFQESVIHLNWIMDHKHMLMTDDWIFPHTLWEAGITSWNLEQKPQSMSFWGNALKFTNYHFEHRLTMKISLAVKHAQELGISSTQIKRQYKLNSSIICASDFYDNDVYQNSNSSESTIATIVANKLSNEKMLGQHTVDQFQ
ncbi:hypothetical protein G6F56_001473 [Rhizopus delemar]|nr:hypothetical protein G6F56_001473 [Rhizopus delemar]